MLAKSNWDCLSELRTANKKLIFSIRGVRNQAVG